MSFVFLNTLDLHLDVIFFEQPETAPTRDLVFESPGNPSSGDLFFESPGTPSSGDVFFKHPGIPTVVKPSTGWGSN